MLAGEFLDGSNVLHLAVAGRNPGVLRWVCALSDEEAFVRTLLGSRDAQGLTPLARAVKEQYVEGVGTLFFDEDDSLYSYFDTLCDEEADECARAVAEAYDMAREAQEGAGKHEHRRLQKICRHLEIALRIVAMQFVRFCALPQEFDKRQAVPVGLVMDVVGDSLDGNCLDGIVQYMEATKWWSRFKGQAESLDRHPEEMRCEASVLLSSIEAAEPSVVLWLLDVWHVRIDSVQAHEHLYSLGDYLVVADQKLMDDPPNLAQEHRIKRPAWEAEWNTAVDRWSNSQHASSDPLCVSSLIEALKGITADEHGVPAYATDMSPGLRWRKLRLLGADPDPFLDDRIATLRLLLQRSKSAAMPSLDLLVRVSNICLLVLQSSSSSTSHPPQR